MYEQYKIITLCSSHKSSCYLSPSLNLVATPSTIFSTCINFPLDSGSGNLRIHVANDVDQYFMIMHVKMISSLDKTLGGKQVAVCDQNYVIY